MFRVNKKNIRVDCNETLTLDFYVYAEEMIVFYRRICVYNKCRIVLWCYFIGKDVIGLAETGSGKTGAFAIPILQALLGKCNKLHR